MGKLRKIAKKIGKGIKKIGSKIASGIRKITRSKAFKIIAAIAIAYIAGPAAIQGWQTSAAAGGGFFANTGAAVRAGGSALAQAAGFGGAEAAVTPETLVPTPPPTTPPVPVEAAATAEAKKTAWSKVTDSFNTLAEKTPGWIKTASTSAAATVGAGLIMQKVQGEPDKVGSMMGQAAQEGGPLGELYQGYQMAYDTNPLKQMYMGMNYGYDSTGYKTT